MSPPLHIASASDAGYYPGLEVLICSTLLYLPRETEVHFHIFDGGLSEQNWKALRAHAARLHPHTVIHPLAFSENDFANAPALHGNKITYARLLLGERFPDLERIIYIDCDIIVGRNLEELRDLEMGDHTILAARDAVVSRLNEDCPWLPESEARNYTYFNAGVLLLNLERFRKRGYLAQCLAAVALHPDKCRYWDQTPLNYVLRDDVGSLPQHWNQVAFTSDAIPSQPVNIHLISDKPWREPFPRFDHYVWSAFYADFVGKRDWTARSTTARKWLYRVSCHPVTRWLFALVMGLIVAATPNPRARARRELMLRGGTSDFSVLKRLRREWLAAFNKVRGEATPSRVSPAVIPAPMRSTT